MGERSRLPPRLEQFIVAGIGVRLENAAIVGEVRLRVSSLAVARVLEERDRRRASAKRCGFLDDRALYS